MMSTAKERIEELLPWHATGKLQNGERVEVETALARDADLRRQLALIEDEIAVTRELNEATPGPLPGAVERFMNELRIEAQPRQMIRETGWKRALAWLSSRVAAPPRWALAAVAAALILQAGVIGGFVIERQGGGYHTAGEPGELAPGAYVLARFADGAMLAEINARLTSLGVTVVDGPKAGGIYTLRIGPEDMPADERDRMIAALRSNAGLIVFVGPVQ
jgi:hypothetical protein